MSGLRLEKVSVRFGGLTALDQVTVDLGAHEIVGLIGPNGAGKSTLVGAITKTIQISSGRMSLDCHDLSRTRRHQLRALGLARTFQHSDLFDSLTVFDNLRIASTANQSPRQVVASVLRDPRQRRRDAEAVARACGVLDMLGGAAWLHEKAGDLPQGAQRMVDIARAMAGSAPRYLLLDEPAAGLSRRERNQLIDAVREIRERYQVGILLIEHDLRMVLALCERVYVLTSGRLVAHGPPDQIRENPDVKRAYVGVDPCLS